MILIGQYDSPFVRRVGIALTLYALPFEHRTWSAFGDADKLRAHNPLGRVPTLVLADGTALLDSHAMLDYLDSLVPAEQALFPRLEPARHRALRVASLATGTGDKAVSLFYEQRLHAEVSQALVERLRGQIAGGLAALEAECAARPGAARGTYWFGPRIGHADIAVACMLRFIGDTQPGLFDSGRYPALAAFCAQLEQLPAFRKIQQAFVPPT